MRAALAVCQTEGGDPRIVSTIDPPNPSWGAVFSSRARGKCGEEKGVALDRARLLGEATVGGGN